jgi:hypothetical protein
MFSGIKVGDRVIQYTPLLLMQAGIVQVLSDIGLCMNFSI